MLQVLMYFIQFRGHTTIAFGFQMVMLVHTDPRDFAIQCSITGVEVSNPAEGMDICL